MIGLAYACKGGTALANYVMKPTKGYELFRNGLSGEAPTEILQEMRIIQDLNQRATKKTFSLVLSPEKNEAKNMSDEFLEKLTKEYLKKLNIDPEEQQYIAFVHTEKSHKHIHIIANRVKENGTLISDHHIGKKAQWAAHYVAIENSIISAKETFYKKMNSKNQEKTFEQAVKDQILEKHLFIIQSSLNSMEEYIHNMEKLGLNVLLTENIKGQIQGIRIKDLSTGLDFKASDISRKMSLNNIMANGLPFENKNLKFHSTIEKTQEVALKIRSAKSIEFNPNKLKIR